MWAEMVRRGIVRGGLECYIDSGTIALPLPQSLLPTRVHHGGGMVVGLVSGGSAAGALDGGGSHSHLEYKDAKPEHRGSNTQHNNKNTHTKNYTHRKPLGGATIDEGLDWMVRARLPRRRGASSRGSR
jgi:hypothetical protein